MSVFFIMLQFFYAYCLYVKLVTFENETSYLSEIYMYKKVK